MDYHASHRCRQEGAGQVTLQLPKDVPTVDGEGVWSRRWANRTQSRVRAAGGRLYLTNLRLLFCPHGVDAALAGEFWQTPLTEIAEVARQKKDLRASMSGGLRTRLRITVRDGSTELFVINKLDDVIAEIQSAVHSA
jgi:hypothetical protein